MEKPKEYLSFRWLSLKNFHNVLLSLSLSLLFPSSFRSSFVSKTLLYSWRESIEKRFVWFLMKRPIWANCSNCFLSKSYMKGRRIETEIVASIWIIKEREIKVEGEEESCERVHTWMGKRKGNSRREKWKRNVKSWERKVKRFTRLSIAWPRFWSIENWRVGCLAGHRLTRRKQGISNDRR